MTGTVTRIHIALAPGDHRRNVTTEGDALNHLVGERFRVGNAVCVGTELASRVRTSNAISERRASARRSSTAAVSAVE